MTTRASGKGTGRSAWQVSGQSSGQPSVIGSRWRPAVAIGLLLVALGAGCASQLTAQVTSFHQIAEPDRTLAGQRFVIQPSDEQRGGLEFARYADLVRAALVSNGLVDAGDGPADLGVRLRYALNGTGGTLGASGTSGGFAIGSGRGGGVSFGIGIGFPIGGGAGAPAESTSYRRELRVTIDRLAPAPPAPPRVFEGQAVSEGPSASLAPVMPAMVRALFDGFPGKSGESRVVRVPLDDAAAQP